MGIDVVLCRDDAIVEEQNQLLEDESSEDDLAMRCLTVNKFVLAGRTDGYEDK